MKNKHPLLIAVAIASFAASSITVPASAQSNFSLEVEKDGQLQQAPTLTRKELVKPSDKDDFSNGDQGPQLDPPQAAFKDEKPQAPPKMPRTNAFDLQADQDGEYGGAQEEARVPGFHTLPNGPPLAPQMPMQAPMMQQQPPQIAAIPPNFNPADPDSTPDMELAWDIWHHRVAQAIFERFELMAKSAFRRSGPLEARISYQVTRDHRIINMSMPEKSPNQLFNVLVYQAVKSLEGDGATLEFPQGSRRMVVSKPGTFQWNFGNDGFKYTTGDREMIPGIH